MLDKKLVWLAELADFKVNINSVIGGGVRFPQDALTVGRRAVELGFSSSLGIIHDDLGTLKPLQEAEREVYLEMKKLAKKSYTRMNRFQTNLIDARRNEWRCRAGSRYLYVCEDGLVHYCSQQRGYPAIPLERYTRTDLRKEYLTEKACADYCTIACVQQVAMFDNWRSPQTLGVKGAVRQEAVRGMNQLYQIERAE